jgi:hypothetical protein
MSEKRISKEDLQGLARKMETIEEVLTPEERAIMLGIFGMASAGLSAATEKAGQIEGVEKVTERVNIGKRVGITAVTDATDLPTLREGFTSSFVAGRPGSFVLGGGFGPVEDSIGVSVGGTCVSVSWSKTISDFAPIGNIPVELGAVEVATEQIAPAEETAVAERVRKGRGAAK